jgi:predicted ATPase
MELVYLWVEEYKNIKQQGFNFSPRFECEFKSEYEKDENGKEKLKNNCELVIKPKEHLENFFGKNINVTAIVGENGSGKSSLQKIIFMLIYYNKFLNINNSEETKHYFHAIANLKYKYQNKSFFLVFKDNTDMYRKILFNTNINCNLECSELKDTEIDFFSVYFNYIFDTWYDELRDKWVNHIYHKNDGYTTPLLLQPNKQNSNTLSAEVNIDTINYLNQQNILKFYEKISDFKSITNFFKPNILKIKNIIHPISYSNNGNYIEFKQTHKIGNQILKIASRHNFNLTYTSDNKILKELKELENEQNFEYINQLYISCKMLLSSKELFDESIYLKIKTNFEKMIKDDILIDQKDLVQPSEFKHLFKPNVSEYEVLKIRKCFAFQEDKTYESAIFNLLFNSQELGLHREEVKDILNSIPPWLDIDFYEDAKSLNTLSSGEKALFTIISNIMYQFNNIHSDDKYNAINIFLDETELGVHPKWQKEYLANILTSIKPLNTKGKKINLIFSTHSPFLLSDLPKENVIFLEKGTQVYPKIDTFGANIHTLLSHGFFMKDGLMGEFAKGKIEDVINYLNDKESTIKDNDEAQKLLNIIGEPVIKNQLQRMLDSKRLSKVDEIDKIKLDMENLAKRLEELEK